MKPKTYLYTWAIILFVDVVLVYLNRFRISDQVDYNELIRVIFQSHDLVLILFALNVGFGIGGGLSLKSEKEKTTNSGRT